jgi:rare lipoprotein A
MTAAHRELPLGTVVEVTNLDNGRTIRVRINDRGPFVRGRILDLSRTAAREAGIVGPGTARVRLTVQTLAPGREPVSVSGLWAVQVGSFADAERARRHADRVRAAGQTVYLEPYRGLSRVKVGPFDSRESARAVLDRLEQQGFEGIVTPGN